MNRVLFLVAITIASCVVSNQTYAQSGYYNGYGFGLGAHYSGQGFGNNGVVNRDEQPPYFAKFPPVYYSHIVPRPYGISPYAAPPGITPIEMKVPVQNPVTILNPYFNDEKTSVDVAPAEADLTPKPLVETKDELAKGKQKEAAAKKPAQPKKRANAK